MHKSNDAVRIELTEQQKQAIRDATGKELSALEFTAEALEERIAPGAGPTPFAPSYQFRAIGY